MTVSSRHVPSPSARPGADPHNPHNPQDPHDWYHGGAGCCSLVSYTPSTPKSSVQRAEQFFVPELRFARLEAPAAQRKESAPGASPPAAAPAALKSDDFESPFSGLLHLRNFSFSSAHNVPLAGPMHICHHSQFEFGEVTYMFGGVVSNAALALEQMGLPRDTAMADVSVQMAVDMPPFVNKDVLMCPSMARNPTLLTFNSLRSTVHNESRPEFEQAEPSHLCEMKGTQISSYSIFFCGGYRVNVDSVAFDESRRRWVVRKSVELNRHGYILDVRRLHFTKINLLTNSEFVYGGRVGAEVCSSFFDAEAAVCEPRLASLSTPLLAESVVPPEPAKPPAAFAADKRAPAAAPEQPPADPKQPPADPKQPSSFLRPFRAHDRRASDSKPDAKDKPRTSPKPRYAATDSPIHSSYANHVKQHRSKTPVASAEPRHASPAITPQKARSVAGSDAESEADESSAAEPLRELQSPAARDKGVAPAPPPPSPPPPQRITSPEDSKRPGTPSSFLMSESPKSGIFSVCVYLFGGFVLRRSDERQHFVATNDFLKIELTVDDAAKEHFHRDALLIKVQNKGAVEPTPRGYFAHVVIPADFSNDACILDSTQPRFAADADSFSVQSEVHSSNESVQTSRMFNGDSYFETKQLVIHGGVDHTFRTHGDFYTFNFEREEWSQVASYSYDYYGIPKQPFEDEDSSLLQLEKQVDNPQIVEAELRCCHHKAISYWEGANEYVTFVGGFTNDALRHFDAEPYHSNKYDVSRLAKLSISATNSNLLRVPVLDFRTQMWKYKRYFYDFSEGVSSEFLATVRQPHMQNARLVFSGGGLSIVGKQFTFTQGLCTFIPEKKADYGRLQHELGASAILVGGHLNLTFPGM